MSWSRTLNHRSGHLAPLDGLRALAVLLVVSYHWLPGLLPLGLMELGWSGVDLFFVLSGFLITGQLLDERGRPGWYGRFLARRALRILPLYCTALLLFMGWAMWSNDAEAQATLAGIGWFWTFTQNIWFSLEGMPGVRGLLNHFWSLGLEEQFYLCWPLLITIVPGRMIPFLALGGMITGLLLRHLYPIIPFAYNFTLTHADGLLWGGAIAWAMREQRPMLERIWRPALLIAVIGLLLLIVNSTPISIHHPLFIRWAPLLFPLLFAGLLCASFATGAGWKRSWQRPLSLPVLAFIGRYSYGIYVIHWPLLLMRDRIEAMLLDAGVRASSVGTVFTLGYFPSVLLLAFLSYHALEEPFLRLKRHFRSPGGDLQATR